MGYVIASYGIVLAAVGGYLLMLQRTRGTQRKALSLDRKSNRG